MSRPGSVKKGAFKNFAKFTGKHLCQSVFFNKVAGQADCSGLHKSVSDALEAATGSVL